MRKKSQNHLHFYLGTKRILEKSGKTHLPKKSTAEAFPQILPKLPGTLQYMYDVNWFPENFVNITEIPSETSKTNHTPPKYTNKEL